MSHDYCTLMEKVHRFIDVTNPRDMMLSFRANSLVMNQGSLR
jgi:hypothetical protein